MAFGILVPWPGIEPEPQLWKPEILTTRPQGNSQYFVLFLWLSNILLCGEYILFCLSIHQLGDFYVVFHFWGGNMNNATNYYIQAFVWKYVFIYLRHIPRNGIVRSYGLTVFNFGWTAKPCYIAAVPFYISIYVWWFQFFHIFDNTCYFPYFLM